jgi:hypothetical protein
LLSSAQTQGRFDPFFGIGTQCVNLREIEADKSPASEFVSWLQSNKSLILSDTGVHLLIAVIYLDEIQR